MVMGFAAAVISVTPVLKAFPFLILPLSAYAALWVYRKLRTDELNNNIKLFVSEAFLIGILTGVSSAFFITIFDSTLTFITKYSDILQAIPLTEETIASWGLGEAGKESINLLRRMDKDISTKGYSVLYSFMLFANHFILNIILCVIGALIGLRKFNKELLQS